MSWKRICASSDVPKNTVKKFEVDGFNVIVLNYGDQFRVYPPLCPHMEESLDETAIIEGQTITCSKHLWEWDMLTGKMQGLAERDLLSYEAKCEGGEVMANIEAELLYEYEEEDDADDDDFFD